MSAPTWRRRAVHSAGTHLLERLGIRNVVHKQRPIRITVVDWPKRMEPLLPGSILRARCTERARVSQAMRASTSWGRRQKNKTTNPNGQLDSPPTNVQALFLEGSLQRDFVFGIKLVRAVALHKRGLANAACTSAIDHTRRTTYKEWVVVGGMRMHNTRIKPPRNMLKTRQGRKRVCIWRARSSARETNLRQA